MTLVKIGNWAGGLGNNLEQIANAYWLARKTNGQFNCIAHPLLKIPKNIKFGNNTRPANHGTNNVSFINKKIDTDNERYRQYPGILQELAPLIFRKIQKKPFDGLVIHVRAGNIYRDPSCGKCLIQAPIAYFAKAMQTLKIKKDVLIITSSRHKKDVKRYPGPIIEEIKKYCQKAGLKCHVRDDLYKEAVGYLLGARHAMLTGYTTFSRMLLLANKDLKTVIIPVMSGKQNGWFHDENSFKAHKCKAHLFDIEDYLTLWNRNHLASQMNHPAEKIKYRGIL